MIRYNCGDCGASYSDPKAARDCCDTNQPDPDAQAPKLVADGGIDPEQRLEEAAKQVEIAREEIDRPDQDSALARAEYLLRGVRDALDEDDVDEIDPSMVTDGGRKLPAPNQKPDRTERALMDLSQTHLAAREWSA